MFPFATLPYEIQRLILSFLPINDKLISQQVSYSFQSTLRSVISESQLIATCQRFDNYPHYNGCVVEKPECNVEDHKPRDLDVLQGQPTISLISKLITDYAIKPKTVIIYSISFDDRNRLTRTMNLLSKQSTIEHFEMAFCYYTADEHLSNLIDLKFDSLQHLAFFKNTGKLLPILENILVNNKTITEISLGKTAFARLPVKVLNSIKFTKLEVVGNTDTICTFLRLQSILLDNQNLKEVVLRDEYDDSTVHCSTLAFNFTILRQLNTSITKIKSASFGSIEKLTKLDSITLISRNCVTSALSECQYVSMLDSIAMNDNLIKQLRIGYGFKCLNDALELITGEQFENLIELGLLTQDGVYDLPVEYRTSAHLWTIDREFEQLTKFRQLRKLEINYNLISDETIKKLIAQLSNLRTLIACSCPMVTSTTLKTVNKWAKAKDNQLITFGFEKGKFSQLQLAMYSRANLHFNQITMKILSLCNINSCKYYKS